MAVVREDAENIAVDQLSFTSCRYRFPSLRVNSGRRNSHTDNPNTIANRFSSISNPDHVPIPLPLSRST